MGARLEDFLKALPGLDADAIRSRLGTLISEERSDAVENFIVFDETHVARDEIVAVDSRLLVEKVLEDLENEFALHLCLEVRNLAPTVVGPRLESVLGLPPGYSLAGVPCSK